VDEGEGDVTEERLAREPKEDGGVFANAPEHGEVFKFIECLAEDVDALVFQFRQVIHKKDG
jgi:hypothetical protein